VDGHTVAYVALSSVLVLLMGAVVYQQWFYSRQIQNLVDRLMARSIQEFELAKNPPPPRVKIKREPDLEGFDRITG
jgi:hypothetical protein